MNNSPKKNVNSARRNIRELLNPSPPEPSWEEWKTVDFAPLWEWIALSCNIEPTALRGWKNGISRVKPAKEFLLRYRQAESDLINERLQTVTPATGGEPQIALKTIRAWCELRGHSLPTCFPRAETTAERNRRIINRHSELEAQGMTRGIFAQLEREFALSRQYISKLINAKNATK